MALFWILIYMCSIFSFVESGRVDRLFKLLGDLIGPPPDTPSPAPTRPSQPTRPTPTPLPPLSPGPKETQVIKDSMRDFGIIFKNKTEEEGRVTEQAFYLLPYAILEAQDDPSAPTPTDTDPDGALYVEMFEPCRQYAYRLRECMNSAPLPESAPNLPFRYQKDEVQALCVCYATPTAPCTATTLDDGFDDNSKKCRDFFEENEYKLMAKIMGKDWVGGENFCSGMKKKGGGLAETLEPTSLEGCQPTGAATAHATSTNGTSGPHIQDNMQPFWLYGILMSITFCL